MQIARSMIGYLIYKELSYDIFDRIDSKNKLIPPVHSSFVYKIPYRRARALGLAAALGQVRRASKGILHTNSS